METLDRSKAPVYQAIQKLDIIEATTQTLPNNIKLHTINAGEQDILRLEIIFPTGNFQETQVGQAFFTGKMLSEGTTHRTAQEINEDIDQYGAFLEISPSSDRLIIAIYTLSKHFSKVLPVLQDILQNSIFPEQELETLKQITTQNIRVNLDKNNYLAGKIFKERIFGKNHPYGRMLEEESVQKMTQEKVANFYTQFIQNQTFELILVGKVVEEHIKTLENTFGKWKIQATEHLRNTFETFQSEAGKAYFEREDKVQSSIRIGKKIAFETVEERIDLAIANEILGGFYGARLMKNIREDKGFTYGIYSRLVQQAQVKYLTIATDVNKEFMPDTLKEIYKEIGILQTTLIEEKELEIVRNYMLGSLASSVNTCFDLAELFKSIYFNHWDYSFYTQYVDRVKTMSPEEIRNTAQKYFALDSFTEIVVG